MRLLPPARQLARSGRSPGGRPSPLHGGDRPGLRLQKLREAEVGEVDDPAQRPPDEALDLVGPAVDTADGGLARRPVGGGARPTGTRGSIRTIPTFPISSGESLMRATST